MAIAFVKTWKLALQRLKWRYCWAKGMDSNRSWKEEQKERSVKPRMNIFLNMPICPKRLSLCTLPFALIFSLSLSSSIFPSLPLCPDSPCPWSWSMVFFWENLVLCARCVCKTGRGSVKDSKTRLTSFCVNLCSCCFYVCLCVSL